MITDDAAAVVLVAVVVPEAVAVLKDDGTGAAMANGAEEAREGRTAAAGS